VPFTLLVATAAAPSVSIELGAAVPWVLGIVGTVFLALLGVIVWFLRREIGRNDEAHAGLRSDIEVVEKDVKMLLAGDVPWVKGMRLEIANLRDEIGKLYRVLLQSRSSGSSDD